MAERLALAGSRVLVTGGAGFIGSNFVHQFLARFPDAHVVVLDALTYAGRRENLEGLSPKQLTFQKGDIRNHSAVAEAMDGCDFIVNFAAESHVDRSIEEPGEFISTDVFGVFVLCEEARKGKSVGRFIQVSTDEVYGEILQGAASEATPLCPRSPYSASKVGGESMAYAYWATHGLPVVITRGSNTYGPRQYPEKLIPLFVTNAIENKPLPVYGNGRNKRDWLYVEDHCEALIGLLESSVNGGEVFNVGAGREFDVLEITNTILELLGKPGSLIQHVEDRPGHDRRYALDSSKLTGATGWRPKASFDEAIKKTVEWYRTNEKWWRPIKEGEFRTYYERMYGSRKVLKEVRA